MDVEELLELGRLLAADVELACGERAGVRLARKLLRVRDRQGKLVPLLANPAQQAYERARGRRNIVLKARQMGISTWVAGRFLLRTMTAQGVLTVQVAQTREAAESLFRIVDRMWQQLPPALRAGPLRRSRANVAQMIFPELDSEFRVVSAADENAGRGMTIHNLHCSELSRWPGDAAATLTGLRAALVPDGEECLESTPNGAYGCFYDEWQLGRAASSTAGKVSSDAGMASATRHFFPWWMEPGYRGAPVEREQQTGDERALAAQHGLTAEQIGFRRGLEHSYRGLRAQEFAEDAESCFRATGACCFDVAALERRAAALPEPLESRRGGALLVWLPPMPGREYLLAIDTAGGGDDGDFCCVQVVDRASGMQCAELRERLAPLELAQAAAALGREYGSGSVIVERNNHGAAVLAYLTTLERYRPLYTSAGAAGWLTTAANKPESVSRLGALLVERPELFRSARLLAECRTFVAGSGGKTGAANGSHDDCVMAMAIAQAVRAESLAASGKNEWR